MTEEQGIEKLLDLIERSAIAAHGAGAITAQEAVSMRVASGALARGYLSAIKDARREIIVTDRTVLVDA